MNRLVSWLQNAATCTFMTRNLSRRERWVRVLGGVVLMGLGLTLSVPFWVEEVAETVGLLAVVTGAVGFCPVKRLCLRARRASTFSSEEEA
jgi:uncharacterized membrane protein HdeD (DUF308 family)